MKTFLIEYKITELDFSPVNRKEFLIAENEDDAREKLFKKFEDEAPTYGFSIKIESVKELHTSDNFECETCPHQVYCIGQCEGNYNEEDD